MNVLILAAGYATRLYPLTRDKAKPLLEVAGKPMLEWILDALKEGGFARKDVVFVSGYREEVLRARFRIPERRALLAT